MSCGDVCMCGCLPARGTQRVVAEGNGPLDCTAATVPFDKAGATLSCPNLHLLAVAVSPPTHLPQRLLLLAALPRLPQCICNLLLSNSCRIGEMESVDGIKGG